MLAADVIEALARLERDSPVATWRVGELHVWPIVRTQLGMSLLTSGEPRAPVSRRPLARYAREVWSTVDAVAARARDRSGNARLAPADALFLTVPSNRQRLDATAFDKFFDPLARVAAERGLATLALEYAPPGSVHAIPRHSPSVLIKPRVFLDQVRVAIERLPDADLALDGYEDFRARVATTCAGANALSVPVLRRQVLAIERVARFFDGCLARVRPRVAFLTSYYNFVGMGLCLAARRRGIVAVDVQHGVMWGNPAHDRWGAFHAGGYELLPRVFWCWSDDDADVVRAWAGAAGGAHRAVVGGHPLFAHWSDDVPEARAALGRARALRGAGPNVLVSLSYESGFTERIERTLRAAPAEFTFWVRMHPRTAEARRDIVARCRALGPARVEVEAPSQLPLPALLRAADAHLTLHSTVVEEAAMLGVPSVVIDARARYNYARVLASGWAAYADTPEAAIVAVRAQIERAPELPAPRRAPDRAELARVFEALVREGNAPPAPPPSTAP